MVEGLVEVPQGEVALLLEVGQLLIEMNKPREAEEVFAGVAALVPQSEVPLVCLGNLFFSRGRFERALKHQREALARQPDSALARAHEGEALLFLQRREEAKAALEQAAGAGDAEVAAFAGGLLDAMAAGVV